MMVNASREHTVSEAETSISGFSQSQSSLINGKITSYTCFIWKKFTKQAIPVSSSRHLPSFPDSFDGCLWEIWVPSWGS